MDDGPGELYEALMETNVSILKVDFSAVSKIQFRIVLSRSNSGIVSGVRQRGGGKLGAAIIPMCQTQQWCVRHPKSWTPWLPEFMFCKCPAGRAVGIHTRSDAGLSWRWCRRNTWVPGPEDTANWWDSLTPVSSKIYMVSLIN